MGDISPHFNQREFACRDGTPAPHVSHALLDVLEKIRALTGKPLIIRSGYRTASWNARVGGARRSRHLYADAADIDQGRATLAQAWAAGAVGVGTKNGWATHVDTRPGPRVTWQY